MEENNSANDSAKMEELIARYADRYKDNKITTGKKVRKYIFDDIWKDYKGKAPKWRVQFAADDIAESVCLRLGIACDF